MQTPCCGVSAVAAVAKEIKLESPPGGSMGKSIAAKPENPQESLVFGPEFFQGLQIFPPFELAEFVGNPTGMEDLCGCFIQNAFGKAAHCPTPPSSLTPLFFFLLLRQLSRFLTDRAVGQKPLVSLSRIIPKP